MYEEWSTRVAKIKLEGHAMNGLQTTRWFRLLLPNMAMLS